MDRTTSNSSSSSTSAASQNPHLGVNKLGRSIRKATPPPPPQPQPAARPPQPQVYNISKNQFRDIVQHLTAGTPSPSPLPPQYHQPHRPPQSQPKPPSMRLQRIRPPPIATPVARPPPPVHPHHAVPNPSHNNPVFHRPPPPQPQQHMPAPAPGPAWADSPVSAYMRILENSLFSATPPGAAAAAAAGQPPPPPVPSPGILPSPSGFLNLLSPMPRSPYPLLSPGFQHPPPFTPNFPVLSPLPGTGILGPGPMPPLSPGLWFPQSPSGLLSPSGFLPILSPRWRDM
ncbi:protein HAIKU1-like [Phragmites australis]|uniref:protein HAIKU1-like n=1 Tax=Phragmites australis TaxID=29695 RepID=UPI002D76BE79|nr:protein HAIKU1-like [Phragmites australis]